MTQVPVVTAPDRGGMSHEACAQALRQATRNFDRIQFAIEALTEMRNGTRELPIISWPVRPAEAQDRAAVDVDLRALVRELTSSADQADQLREQLLHPLHVYFYKRYVQTLSDIRQYAERLSEAPPMLPAT